ncbi:MAG: alcohol dehydrogenase [Planctomycetota bacterium]|nr:MAG: alcohol dehydrogenase [Planctomycetota bacterium]
MAESSAKLLFMIPTQQSAIQLVGPDQLVLVDDKPVHTPNAKQILGKVSCVGLCFSDMKLLKQFQGHARKSPVVQHLDAEILKEIPTYVPDEAPTVPGHEVVIEVVAVGEDVTSVEVGRKYLVQADWRDLKTAGSNGAFGYNFEGGLQQYVLLDERTTISADGTSYLLPTSSEERSVSATALVEPWACVEQAFIHNERQSLRDGGTVLLVRCSGQEDIAPDLAADGSAKRLCLQSKASCTPPDGYSCVALDDIADGSIDDCLFIGADPDLFESILPKLANNALTLIATNGQRFARQVSMPVGRVHYGNIRFVGDESASLRAALGKIPETGEIRTGDRVHVVGAAGPMGSMATIRLVSSGVPGIAVEASDMAEERLAVLRRKASKAAAKNGVACHFYNPRSGAPEGDPNYVMLMVPVGPLVAAAVTQTQTGGIINIFAGIAADVFQDCDLDAYVAKGLYFIGTSGSTMRDMEVVLSKVNAGDLDTNLSVGAVSGITGAIPGLEAVRDGTIAGKILVYPELGDFPLTTLEDLVVQFPSIGPLLDDGDWTKAAEEELLRLAGK